MHYGIQSPFSISITIINGLIHLTICHRKSAAIRIGRLVCLCSSAAICIDRSICHRWRAAICIGQPICHPESAAICIDQPICHPESAAICIDCTNMPPSSIWFTIHIEIHIVLSKVWGYIQLYSSSRSTLASCISWKKEKSIRWDNNVLCNHLGGFACLIVFLMIF